ncbi:unnamed protein product, partial [Allacma fusca]
QDGIARFNSFTDQYNLKAKEVDDKLGKIETRLSWMDDVKKIIDARRLKSKGQTAGRINPLLLKVKDRFKVSQIREVKSSLKRKFPQVFISMGMTKADKGVNKFLYEELKRYKAANPEKIAKFISSTVIIADGIKYVF